MIVRQIKIMYLFDFVEEEEHEFLDISYEGARLFRIRIEFLTGNDFQWILQDLKKLLDVLYGYNSEQEAYIRIYMPDHFAYYYLGIQDGMFICMETHHSKKEHNEA